MTEAASHFISSISRFFTAKTPSSLQALICLEFPSLPDKDIIDICNKSVTTLQTVDTLSHVTSPIIIVGDIHGNLVDLIRIFQQFGLPPETKYLFLGDYVDRGLFSLPCILILLSFFILFPSSITLLRGNHEFSHINRIYGFFDEIGSDCIWELFQEVFSWFPLAAVVNNKIFCVHGGLSPSLQLKTIKEIQRPIRSYEFLPVVCDLVWSDPDDSIDGFRDNQRGAGVLFGTSALTSFLHENELKLILRAHQCNANGIECFSFNCGATVFSSSNYIQIFPNKCGVVYVKSQFSLEFHSFSHQASFDPPIQMKLLQRAIGMQKVSFANNLTKSMSLTKTPLNRTIIPSPAPADVSVSSKKNPGFVYYNQKTNTLTQASSNGSKLSSRSKGRKSSYSSTSVVTPSMRTKCVEFPL